MRQIIISIFILFTYNVLSQANINSSSYNKIINGKIESGDKFILKVNYCLKKPLNNPTCPFCNCYSIDSLVNILKTVPKYNIEIITNTDFRGKELNNLNLSKSISKSIRNYLINSSIDSTRITAIGLGSTQLYIFKNDTVIKNINVKKGTVVNKEFTRKIINKELKEQLISLNRRIIIRFIF